MPSEKLQVILELVTGNYKREAREAATATGQIGDAAQRSTGGMSNLVGGMLKLGAAIGVAGIGRFAFDSIKAASSLEESINAVNVVFGEAADKIHEFGETSVDSVGLAASHVNEGATVMGSALINVGFSADEAADKTIELTQRAADMASVFNTEVPEALGAIQSALRGETDPIERFGVSLTAAAVDAEAAALGFKKLEGQFDPTAKAAARLSIIMQQTDRVSGDFANTADSTANTMKRLKERFVEMQARIGTALMPAFKALLDVADKMGPAFEDLAKEIANTVSEMKPLLEGLGQLVEWYSAVKGSIDDATESDNKFAMSLGTLADILTGSGLGAISKGLDFWDRITLEGKDATKETDNLTRATAGLHDSWMNTVPTLAAAEEKVGRLSTAQRLAGEATRFHHDQLVRLADFLAAQISPVLAARQALDKLAEAHTAAQDAAIEHGRESDEFALAQIELALATAEAESALGTFGANAPASIDAVAEALGITSSAAQILLETLGLLDGMTVTATVAIRQVNLLEEGVIPEGMGLPRSRPEPPAGTLQHGGPATAGRPYLVGERGPELMVPHQSGMVLPNGWNRPNSTIVIQSPMNDFAQDLQLATILATVNTMVEVQ